MLYAVTDGIGNGSCSSIEKIRMALEGGITMLQLREKHLSKEDYLKKAILIKELCEAFRVPLIINDHVEVALESGADGVHLGSTDMDIAEARRLLGPDKIIGATAKTIESALRCREAGADYLGCGAVFESFSKKEAVPISLEALKEITESVDIPVVAIGGITYKKVDLLKDCGISGIAVINGIFGQEDIRTSAGLLKEKVFCLLQNDRIKKSGNE